MLRCLYQKETDARSVLFRKEQSMTGVQLSWVGNESTFVDQMDIQTIGPVAVGRFGGCSRAGQTKNEDGCLIWLGDDWEFTLVLDAHDTAESAIAVVRRSRGIRKKSNKRYINRSSRHFRHLNSWCSDCYRTKLFGRPAEVYKERQPVCSLREKENTCGGYRSATCWLICSIRI